MKYIEWGFLLAFLLSASGTPVSARDGEAGPAEMFTQTKKEASAVTISSDETRVRDRFLPLQENQQLYYDWKYRFPVPPYRASTLSRYKPNFGKVVWVKSHFEKDLIDWFERLGPLEGEKNMRLTPIEIGKEVGPYLDTYLKKLENRNKTWADNFEKWGRSYIDLRGGGKEPINLELRDYRNGNFLLLDPRKGKGRVCYFIPEKFDSLVKALLNYRTREERKKPAK